MLTASADGFQSGAMVTTTIREVKRRELAVSEFKECLIAFRCKF